MGELFIEVLRSIRAHKLRFALTSLGIAWGALMLTFLAAQIGTMNEHFRHELEEIGPKLVMMGRGVIPHERVGERMSRTLDLEPQHVERIEALEVVEHASPNIELFNTVVRHGRRTKLLEVNGWDEDGALVRNVGLAEGRFITPGDVADARRVAVLGPEAHKRLFGRTPALGETIEIDGIPFRVIGVTTEKGTQISNVGNPDDQLVIIPYTSAERWFQHTDDVNELVLTATTREQSQAAIEAVRGLVSLHEHFAPDTDTSMWSMNYWETLKTLFGMFTALQLFFVVAGVVTLFVGAIGVMNMMLVVVGERTWEIGLRKALGARSRDVFAQFLLEATLVSSSAGVLGAAGGVALLQLTKSTMAAGGIFVTGWPDPLTTAVITLSLVGVAIVAGLMPALRAARISPAEALRAY
ncbi:MAG: ABC transporter permease [Myxococcota bacterium]|jgi:putative ABC transport system permease protein